MYNTIVYITGWYTTYCVISYQSEQGTERNVTVVVYFNVDE